MGSCGRAMGSGVEVPGCCGGGAVVTVAGARTARGAGAEAAAGAVSYTHLTLPTKA